MKKRALGKTGIDVSEVAFGGVEIGMPYGIGINSRADMPTEKEAINLLRNAMDSGINFFDTARVYGESEMIMGKAFRNQRYNVVICTKCQSFLDEDNNLPRDAELKKIIQESLKDSLKALQTDHVDILMLHSVNMEVLENEEILNVFFKLKNDGVIRATGVSTYLPTETKRAIDSGFWDVIQLPFNLMDQRQKEFFSLAKQQEVGIIIRSVLMKGLLSNRGKNLHPALKEVEKHIACYNELLEDTDYNLSTLAIKFALSFPEVSSILVGIDREEYLHQLLKAANGIYLNQGKMKRANQLAYPEADFLNLHHWHVMNWLK